MGTDIHSVFQKRTDSGWEDVESNYSQDRCYALFARLGNVRNGHGFAGCPTHERIEPLSDCRGYPEDFEVDEEDMHPISCSPIRGRRAEWYRDEDADPENPDHLRMWMGDHSHSWLSDSEILNAQVKEFLRTGIVDVEWFRAWDGNKAPDSWWNCGRSIPKRGG